MDRIRRKLAAGRARFIAAGALFFAITAPACATDESSLTAPVDFNRDIRPILSENCFACHGPDEGRRKAKLRLDVRESALTKAAIVPGKPDNSELVTRIFHTDAGALMPPPKSNKSLTPQQKSCARWISKARLSTALGLSVACPCIESERADSRLAGQLDR